MKSLSNLLIYFSSMEFPLLLVQLLVALIAPLLPRQMSWLLPNLALRILDRDSDTTTTDMVMAMDTIHLTPATSTTANWMKIKIDALYNWKEAFVVFNSLIGSVGGNLTSGDRTYQNVGFFLCRRCRCSAMLIYACYKKDQFQTYGLKDRLQ